MLITRQFCCKSTNSADTGPATNESNISTSYATKQTKLAYIQYSRAHYITCAKSLQFTNKNMMKNQQTGCILRSFRACRQPVNEGRPLCSSENITIFVSNDQNRQHNIPNHIGLPSGICYHINCSQARIQHTINFTALALFFVPHSTIGNSIRCISVSYV